MARNIEVSCPGCGQKVKVGLKRTVISISCLNCGHQDSVDLYSNEYFLQDQGEKPWVKEYQEQVPQYLIGMDGF